MEGFRRLCILGFLSVLLVSGVSAQLVSQSFYADQDEFGNFANGEGYNLVQENESSYYAVWGGLRLNDPGGFIGRYELSDGSISIEENYTFGGNNGDVTISLDNDVLSASVNGDDIWASDINPFNLILSRTESSFSTGGYSPSATYDGNIYWYNSGSLLEYDISSGTSSSINIGTSAGFTRFDIYPGENLAVLNGNSIIDSSPAIQFLNLSDWSSVKSFSTPTGGAFSYSPSRNIVIEASTGGDTTNSSNNCYTVYNYSSGGVIDSSCSNLGPMGELDDFYQNVHISEDYSTVYFLGSDRFNRAENDYWIFELENNNSLDFVSAHQAPTVSYGGTTENALSFRQMYDTGKEYESYFVSYGEDHRPVRALGYVVRDSEPIVRNLETEPSSVSYGDSVSVSVESLSPADNISSVSLDVYEDGVRINSSVSMTDPNGDNFYNASDVFTASEADYTLVVSASDTENRTSSLNYSFSSQNLPPSVDSINVTPSDPEGGDTVGFEASVSDPENNISSVSYALDEEGSQVESGSMVLNGSIYVAENVYTVSEGTDYSVSVTAEDGANNSASDSLDFYVDDPPVFNFESPENDTLFLTDTDVGVQFDYGVETSEDGTIELLVNGFVVDSTQNIQGDDSEGIHVENYSPPVDAFWSLEFTSDVTGESYSSDIFRTFYVRENPASVSLDAPPDTNVFNVNFSENISVAHNFTVDSEGFSGSYVYNFLLEEVDSNQVIENFTSSSLSGGGIDSYSRTVNDLGEGSYSWTVETRNSTSGSVFDAASRTYEIDEPGIYSISTLEPDEGEEFETPADSNVTDVNASYRVVVESEDVNVTVTVDGDLVETRSLSGGSGTQTFNVTLSSLEEGSHTFTVEGEDESDRVKSDSVTFEVVPDDVGPEFTTVRTTPSLDEAQSGDDVSLYFEGIEGSSEIDYVQVEVLVNGTVNSTRVIQADELNEGSFWFQYNVLTVTDQLLGSNIELRLTAVDVAGRAVESILSGILGENRDPSVELQQPEDAQTFEEAQGSPENHRFVFDITTNENTPLYYNFWMKQDNASLYTLVENVNVTQADSTVTKERFINVVDDVGLNQFGEFDWYVEVYDPVQDEFFRSLTYSFNITPEQVAPVLNFNTPRDNDVVFTPNENVGEADVTFDFGVVDSPEPGTLSAYVDGDLIFEEDVDAGDSARVENETIPVGVYEARVVFDSESYRVEKRHEFAVERFEPEPSSNTVSLRSPSGGNQLYQDVAQVFSWRVWADNEFNTTLYVEDAGDSVVRSFSRSSDHVQQLSIFRELEGMNLSVGDYQFWAELNVSNNNQTYNTSKRNFTVVDFNLPGVSASAPSNNSVFTVSEEVTWEWSVETFDESADTVLLLWERGEFDKRVLLNSSQSAFSTESYSVSEDLPAGRYAWRVRNTVNPSGSSSTYFLTVEEEDIQDPDFSLTVPEQNDTYSIPFLQSTATVYFNFSGEVYSNSDSTVRLQLSSESGGLQNYSTLSSFQQNTQDGSVDYSVNDSLSEDGYLWRVRVAHPGGESFTFGPVGFAVGNATAPQPGDGVDEPSEGGLIGDALRSLGALIGTFGSVIGVVGRFLVSALLIILVSGLVVNWTGFVDLGLGVFVLLSLLFVAAGWLPGWVGAIIFLVSAGLFVRLVGKATGGD